MIRQAQGVMYRYEPDDVMPPGATLEEVLEDHGMTQADLARRTGLSTKHINQMIKGVASISQDIALRLERTTGVPARTWNSLEAAYQEYLTRKREAETLQPDTDWLKHLPVAELVKRGWIRKRATAVDQLREVLAFFGVANREAFNALWANVAFRKTNAFESSPGAVAAWLRIGELEASRIQCETFDRARFSTTLQDLRQLTLEPDSSIWVPALQERCATSGVAVVITPEIPKCRVYGATRWLTPDRALIQLSFRRRSNDVFWFTFFHEARHVLQQTKRQVFLEESDNDADIQTDELELDADEFARNFLIPPQYSSALKSIRSFSDVHRLAASLNTAPGIVVGRLHHDQLKPWNWGQKLIWRYKFVQPIENR